MKVGLVIYGSLDTLSGGYLYDRRLVAHLRDQGDTVEVFSLPWRSYGRHLLDNLPRRWWARLLRADLDVLIQDELNHPSLVTFNHAWRRARPDVPLISIVHHLRCSEARPPWHNALYAKVERRYLKTLDGFVFNSQTTRQVVERLAPARPNVVAYPGGDRLGQTMTADAIAARATAQGPLRLLFLGNVIERKGLLTLLRALGRLSDGGWRLEVVGGLEVEPAHTAEVRALITRLGLGDKVTLHGPRHDAELLPHFKAAHALVVPSSYEGFGIVYMEAASFGLPAIASTAGAAGEIVAHGHSGYLVTPGDDASLASHLRRWRGDRGALARMGQEARRRFDQHPTWTQSAQAIREFLASMVNGDTWKASRLRDSASGAT